MKKLIVAVFAVLIIVITVLFVVLGTVRDPRFYISVLILLIGCKIALSFVDKGKR
jgi:hypothetical protein